VRRLDPTIVSVVCVAAIVAHANATPAQVRDGTTQTVGDGSGPVSETSVNVGRGSSPVHERGRTVSEGTVGSMKSAPVRGVGVPSMLSGPVSESSSGAVTDGRAAPSASVARGAPGTIGGRTAPPPIGEPIPASLDGLDGLRAELRRRHESAVRETEHGAGGPVTAQAPSPPTGDENPSAARPDDGAAVAE
jgi:hypothetical protein